MAGQTLPEFVDKVSEIMSVISREFYKHGTREFYKTRITLVQLALLDTLVREGQSRMTDLARQLNVSTAAMTGIVARLVRDGYVSRIDDQADRRIIKVRLTAKGNKIFKAITDQRKKIFCKIFGIISERDREEYLRILTTVKNSLQGQRS
jgi:DNA-binding MarR family transcriptional regulator